MQPGKSRDSLQASKSQENFEIMEEDHQEVAATKVMSTPRSSQCVKDVEKKKQELLSTCIKVLENPQLPQQCHFSRYVSEKLHKFHTRTRAIAEKCIVTYFLIWKSMVHSLSITSLCKEISIFLNIATLVMVWHSPEMQ